MDICLRFGIRCKQLREKMNLLLAILAILAIIKHQWLQVGIFTGMAGVGAALLFLSANIQILLESSLEKLKS